MPIVQIYCCSRKSIIMPNIAKKKPFSQDGDTALEADMEEFGFDSLDDLATMMVEALTLPLPADFRDANGAKGSDIGQADPLAPQSSKRIN